MSTCPKKDLYSAFVDGEVPSPWKEKLEAHLEICTECRKVVESYKNLKQRIRNSKSPDINLDASFERLQNRRLSNKIRNNEAQEKPNWFTRSIKIPIPAIAAAAIFFLVFMPVLIVNTRKPEIVNEVVIASFKPIMPDSQVLSDQDSTEFDFNELNSLSLNVIKDIDKEKKEKLNFNQFIKLYLPGKNTKSDILLLNSFDKNTAFTGYNFQNFNVNYNKNGK